MSFAARTLLLCLLLSCAACTKLQGVSLGNANPEQSDGGSDAGDAGASDDAGAPDAGHIDGDDDHPHHDDDDDPFRFDTYIDAGSDDDSAPEP